MVKFDRYNNTLGPVTTNRKMQRKFQVVVELFNNDFVAPGDRSERNRKKLDQMYYCTPCVSKNI